MNYKNKTTTACKENVLKQANRQRTHTHTGPLSFCVNIIVCHFCRSTMLFHIVSVHIHTDNKLQLVKQPKT